MGRLDAARQGYPPVAARRRHLTVRGLLSAAGAVGLASVVSLGVFPGVGAVNLAMVYVLAVAIAATWCTPLESALAAALSVLAYNFCFVPPRWTLAVSDSRELITFGVMLTVALVVSTLTQRLKGQIDAATVRELRSASLYRLSRQLAQTRSKRGLAQAAANEIRDVFGGDVAVLLSDGSALTPLAPSKSGFEAGEVDRAAIDGVRVSHTVAGRHTPSHADSAGTYLPMMGSSAMVGVVAFRPPFDGPVDHERMQLLETFVNGLGLALERALLAKESNEARVQAEKERLRSTILSSISHDLRTPLTSIAGAASSLCEGIGDPKVLASTIYEQSLRLDGEIQNLLDMTRLQSEAVAPDLGWFSLSDVAYLALERARPALAGRGVHFHVPEDLPLLKVDGVLVEKAIANLLENAGRHTQPDDPIALTAGRDVGSVWVEVADSGPGFGVRSEPTKDQVRQKGHGLGLAVCDAIMNLHGGTVEIGNREAGPGAWIRLRFPAPGAQPEVPVG